MPCIDHPYLTVNILSRKDLNSISESAFKLTKLDKDNWISWKAHVLNLLAESGAEKVVTGEISRPEEKEHVICAANWDALDQAGYSILTRGLLDKEVGRLPHIDSPTRATANQIWQYLVGMHKLRGSILGMQSLKEFLNTRSAETVDIMEHIEEMEACRVKLESLGHVITEQDFKTQLICSLPLSWETYAESSFAPDGNVNNVNITTDQVIMHIRNEYERRKKVKQETEQAETSYQAAGHSLLKRIGGNPPLSSTSGKRQKLFCPICKRTNHVEADCYFRNQKNPLKCARCRKFGHQAKDCWSKNRRGQGKGKAKGKNQAAVAKTEAESSNIAKIMELDDESDIRNDVTKNSGNNSDSSVSLYTWHADSAATCHVTGDLNAFHDFDPHETKVKGVGGIEVRALGRGTIKVRSKVGSNTYKLTLRDVHYVPGTTDNLLSIIHLARQGGSAYLGKRRALIYDKNKTLVATGGLKHLYDLDLTTIYPETAQVAQTGSSWDDWHARYGHVSIENLKMLFRKDLTRGLNVDLRNPPSNCLACAKCKATRKPFPKRRGIRSRKLGELIHTDIWGPTRHTSLGGKRYFLTCIDDYSRYMTVYFLKHKSDAFGHLTEYAKAVKDRTGRMPKALRADNGKEYVNRKLQSWCREKGIQIQYTAPYSPQQNGVAERANRTLVELTRAMLKARNVPKTLWPTAVSHAAYVRNRAYTRAIYSQTPYERWNNEKPNVTKLQEYGTPVEILREAENQSKLEPKTKTCTFLGFEDHIDAIRYYDAETHNIKFSRNFRFVTPQREGESSSSGDSTTLRDNKVPERKRKRVEEEEKGTDALPRRSTRQRAVHDYSQLNDPPIEIAQIIRNEEEDVPFSFDKAVYTALVNSSVATDDPKTLEEAMASPEWPEWENAIQTELDQLRVMGTWSLVNAPKNRKPVANKWVFIKKFNKDGQLTKYKARLVAKGFSQIPGMDFNQTFAPVVRFETIRTILAEAVQRRWKLRQMDVKGAYLNGYLKEEVYMDQPYGFGDGTSKVCRLVKTLYGLKQSGREWNEELNRKLTKKGFRRLISDPCAYRREENGHVEILTVWVDDLMLFTNDDAAMTHLIADLREMFEITDLGEPGKIVGIEITINKETGEVKLTQTKYIEALLTKYGLENANGVAVPMDPNIKFEKPETSSDPQDRSNTYASLIGSLMFIAVATRPDIVFAVFRLASYTANPDLHHWSAAKRILRYLSSTRYQGIVYRPGTEAEMVGYSDASFASFEDMTSVTGYVFKAAGGAITWASKKQKSVSLSTTEAEYACMADAAREAVWLQNLHDELGFGKKGPTLIHGDNQGALAIANNPQYHKRTKHFDIKHHYIREKVNDRSIKIEYCPTEDMTADIFTKPLPKPKYQKHKAELGIA